MQCTTTLLQINIKVTCAWLFKMGARRVCDYILKMQDHFEFFFFFQFFLKYVIFIDFIVL